MIEEPSICCPFHQEDTPSFSFSLEKGLWRCWGSCKVGGDVIALHQKNKGFKTKAEAAEHLAKLLNISAVSVDFTRKEVKVDSSSVELGLLISQAIRFAKTIDDFIALDFIISQFKPRSEMLEDLKQYVTLRGGVVDVKESSTTKW